MPGENVLLNGARFKRMAGMRVGISRKSMATIDKDGGRKYLARRTGSKSVSARTPSYPELWEKVLRLCASAEIP